jgi:polyhydroxybutyrate depolymerase
VSRQFRLFQPTGVAGPVPLLIALHQYGGTPLNFANMTGFGQLAASDGVMVAFPAGIGATWNAGGCCGTAMRREVDDVAFLAALLDALQDPAVVAIPADPNRVYVTGFSNGAMMSLRVACELADRVTAIAPLAGDLLVECRPSRAVSVLALHGTADAAVPYEALGSVAYTWSRLDGCEEDFATQESSGTIEEIWHGCADGTQLMTVTAKEQGHVWFTADPAASEEIWAFFSPLRREP